jgi:hypothetical protein
MHDDVDHTWFIFNLHIKIWVRHSREVSMPDCRKAVSGSNPDIPRKKNLYIYTTLKQLFGHNPLH